MTGHVHCLAQSATVALYGPIRPTSDRKLALIHGAREDSVCLVKAASSKQDRGFLTIMEPEFGLSASNQPDIYADVVYATKPGTGIVTWRADCPSVVFVVIDEKDKKGLAVVHAGRPAMTPTNQPGETISNIITATYEAIVAGCVKPRVHAYIVGAICGNCFVHEGPGDEELIEPFDQFGEIAFTNRARGALDLVSIIKHQLTQLGVPKQRVHCDGICTYESADLASYRRDRSPARNAVVAVLL